MHAYKLYGWALFQNLPYDEIKSDKNVKVQDILNTEENREIGYILEVDLSYADETNERNELFPFCLEKKVSAQNVLRDHMNKTKSKTYTPCRKLICDCTPKERYLIHQRKLQIFVKLVMVVAEVHEVILFRQSRWLKLFIDSNTNKRAAAKNNSDKDLLKYINCCFNGKTMENVRNRVKTEFNKKITMINW